MEIFDKTELVPLDVIKRMITEYVEEYLTSESNKYVVYDGTAKLLFEGTLNECCAYKRIVGRDYLAIESRESYDEMCNKLKIS